MNLRLDDTSTNFWWRWVIGTATGAGIGMLLYPIALIPNFLSRFGVSSIVLIGFVVFGLTAVAQGMLLRQYGVRARWWIIATVGGVVTFLFLQSNGAYFFPFIRYGGDSIRLLTRGDMYTGIGIGFMIGLFQWFVLRNHFRNASWWIVISTVAFSLGLPFAVNAGLSGATFYGSLPGGIVSPASVAVSEAAALGGILMGAITGFGILWFVQRQESIKAEGLG